MFKFNIGHFIIKPFIFLPRIRYMHCLKNIFGIYLWILPTYIICVVVLLF